MTLRLVFSTWHESKLRWLGLTEQNVCGFLINIKI